MVGRGGAEPDGRRLVPVSIPNPPHHWFGYIHGLRLHSRQSACMGFGFFPPKTGKTTCGPPVPQPLRQSFVVPMRQRRSGLV